MNGRTGMPLLAGILLLTGCTVDAAATQPTPSTRSSTTLTLAFTGGFAADQVAAFESALLESGMLDLAISADYDTDTFGIEQLIVQAVADGDVDLGWVGARAFSELGVTAFDPLVAPFAIDSLQTQAAVLESDLPDRMLSEAADLGVEGLAVVGGPLRRPIAADAPLLSAADFEGVPIYTFHGVVAARTMEALGAQNVDAAPPERDRGLENGSIRGYENTVSYLSNATDRRANIMTSNVNLWPGVGVLIVNPDVLAGLSEEQAEVLRAAAASAAEQSLDVLTDEAQLVAEICGAGGRFATSSDGDLAGLRAAVAPVLAAISSNTNDAAALDEIARLRGDTPADSLDIPTGCEAG